jgi:methanogenic corrinoid protein MtbC1
MRGQKGALEWTQQALDDGADPEHILRQGIMRGVTCTVEKLSKNEVYWPDVHMTRKAASAALTLLYRANLKKTGSAILGSVERNMYGANTDDRDLGKEIVKPILEAANWEVVDIGEWVSTETVVNALAEYPSAIVVLGACTHSCGLEKLHTVVAGIKKVSPRIIVLVGGKALDDDTVKGIGADVYVPRATAIISLLDRTIPCLIGGGSVLSDEARMMIRKDSLIRQLKTSEGWPKAAQQVFIVLDNYTPDFAYELLVTVLSAAIDLETKGYNAYRSGKMREEWLSLCDKALLVLAYRFPTAKTFRAICTFLGASSDEQLLGRMKKALKMLAIPSPEDAVALLGGEDRELGRIVADALGEESLPSVRRLLDDALDAGSEEECLRAVRGIELIRPSAEETERIVSLVQGMRSVPLRIAACGCIVASHPEVVLTFALSALKKTEKKGQEFRAALVRLLGRLCDDEAVEPLISALQDPDDNVKLEAIRALGQFDSKKALATLLDIVQDNRAPDAHRVQAFEVLASSCEPWTESFVERVGRSYAGAVKAKAAEYLPEE